MAGASSTITLIEQLGNLKPTLALQDNQGARQDALRLSKRLVMELGQPPNVVVDLAYSVRQLARGFVCTIRSPLCLLHSH